MTRNGAEDDNCKEGKMAISFMSSSHTAGFNPEDFTHTLTWPARWAHPLYPTCKWFKCNITVSKQTSSYQLSNQTWLHRSCSAKLQLASSVFFNGSPSAEKPDSEGCWGIVLAPCPQLGWAELTARQRTVKQLGLVLCIGGGRLKQNSLCCLQRRQIKLSLIDCLVST